MPIAAFENRGSDPLIVTIEPCDAEYEVPHLATIGIRYVFKGAEERTHSSVSEGRIYFWCDDPDHEVDIVLPSAFDRLLWDVCVRLGHCGGIVEGVPTRVTDLLPSSGEVTAEGFAELVFRAEYEGESVAKALRRWGDAVAHSFIEHVGAASAPAEALKQNLRRPFDPPAAS